MEASKRAAQVSSSSIKMIILFKWISKYLLSQQLAHPGPRRWPGVKVSVLGPDVLSSKPAVTKDSTYICGSDARQIWRRGPNVLPLVWHGSFEKGGSTAIFVNQNYEVHARKVCVWFENEGLT
ncbi:hypothetical protein AVEN_274921-1 [Araneus ventricosus]|uniref:Uncharacterized protein n=1 Tax=Araneus ventricosus TaxID=182803 RepID=A0A4Y2Q7D9_ARAVE|nr:hypothetical protein AVEN_274921-1 [Araneus ventricosus]